MAGPLDFNQQRLLANVQQATDDDLLNRITVYRAGMEPEAIELIERELRDRGVTAADIAAHRESKSSEVIYRTDGTAAKCSFCHAPAVSEGWGWHQLFGKVPLFPRYFYRCRNHS